MRTAALLKNGEVLVVGNAVGGGAAALYNPTTGRFAFTGSPLASDGSYRDPNLSIALSDGRVLVFGPFGTQLYDPSIGKFSVTDSEPGFHTADAAVLLRDGRVLAVGGDTDTGPVVDADIYEPATGTFTRVGSMKTARSGETLTLLRDGRVLVAGGDEGQATSKIFSSAELYDPATGRWSSTGEMTTVRSAATATLLDNNEVLIAGGTHDYVDSLASAELYDPTTGRFTKTGSMSVARMFRTDVGRQYQTATLLHDGRVLIVGGDDEGPTAPTAEIFDPRRGTFTPTGGTSLETGCALAVLLADGRVLVLTAKWDGTTLWADLYWP